MYGFVLSWISMARHCLNSIYSMTDANIMVAEAEISVKALHK
jgi:hypothetical protein